MALGRASGGRVDHILNRLSDYTRLSEPDGEVRRAVLITLAKARSFAMISRLQEEDVRQRKNEDEFRIAWDYLFSMAGEINPASDYSKSFPGIEQMLLAEFARGAEASPYVVSQSWQLRDSAQVADQLIEIIAAEGYPADLRAAACRAACKMRSPKARHALASTLDHCLKNDAGLPLAREAALALAYIFPGSLLKLEHPVVERALWQMSLDTGRMIIGKRIVDPEDTVRLTRRGKVASGKYKVALTFAGEQRGYVREVAVQLARKIGRKNVFYDEWYEWDLARMDLDLRLIEIYRNADLVVPFFSLNYEKKMWCRLEWRVVRSLLLERRNDVMFCRFDKVEILGLLPQDGYIDLKKYDPSSLAGMIVARLRSG